MSLETIQKVIDLLLKTVAGCLLAAAGLYLTYHSSLIAGGSTCSTMGTKLFDVSSEKGTGDSVQVKLVYLIDIYDNSDCQKLTQEQKDFLLGSVKISKPKSSQGPQATDVGSGISNETLSLL